MFDILYRLKTTRRERIWSRNIKKAVKIGNLCDDSLSTRSCELERSVLQFFVFFEKKSILLHAFKVIIA